MTIRFQASWEINKMEDNKFELFSLFKRKKYVIRSKHPNFFLFLELLRKGINYPKDMSEISKKIEIEESILDSLILQLKAYDLLVEYDLDLSLQDSLYDRQVRFFRSFENQNNSGEQFNENLQNSTVLIVGLGGYGSWTALLCARIGIRNIVGVDFDRVEITNLHRQVLYDQKDLGELKVKACEKKIKECDSSINFEGHCIRVADPEDLSPLIKDVDLVFNPFSYLPLKKSIDHPAGIIARAAIAMSKPCLTFGGSWIGPLTLPGESPCYFCAVQELEAHAVLDPDQRNPNIQKRAFAPPIATCCSLAVFEASRFLAGYADSQVLKGVMQLDILSFSNSRFSSLEKNHSCAFCSLHGTRNLVETL